MADSCGVGLQAIKPSEFKMSGETSRTARDAFKSKLTAAPKSGGVYKISC